MREPIGGGGESVAASVVIPTKDRPELLSRCLQAVVGQSCESAFEVIVVNDAGCSLDAIRELGGRVTLVEAPGVGPAGARNVGITHAFGEFVAFTDDDVIPQPGWLEAALAALRESDAVGVLGPVESPAWDPLYEHSVRGDSLGNFLTCNAVYRRAALDRVGGFDTGFPHAHGEDRDLGYRLLELGALVYEPEMRVLHPPRRVGFRAITRRGRLVESEWRLHYRHPQTRPPRWSRRWGPVVRLARHWLTLLREHDVIQASPRRAARFALLASAQMVEALAVTVRRFERSSAPLRAGAASGALPAGAATGADRRRVALIGTELATGGPTVDPAWPLVKALARQGWAVDWYAGGADGGLSESLALPGVRLITFDAGWRPGRWYSRRAFSTAISRRLCALRERRRLAALLAEQHRFRPYDGVYRFAADGQLPAARGGREARETRHHDDKR